MLLYCICLKSNYLLYEWKAQDIENLLRENVWIPEWIVPQITSAIDFFINGLWTKYRLLSQRSQHHNIKVNCQFGDKNWDNEQFWYHDSQIFWEFQSSIFACFYIRYNMFPESFGFVALPVTSCINDMYPMYPYLICEGRRNCSTMLPAQQRKRNSQESCFKI